jgi:hypothetical protein
MEFETQERKLCERRFERSQKSACSPLGQNSIGLTGFDVKRSLRIAMWTSQLGRREIRPLIAPASA